MNSATRQSLEFVNLTFEQILIHKTYTGYETYIVWTWILYFLGQRNILNIVMGNGNGNPHTSFLMLVVLGKVKSAQGKV
jgi:hypothetical protein